MLPVTRNVWHMGVKTAACAILGRGKLKKKHLEEQGIDGSLYKNEIMGLEGTE